MSAPSEITCDDIEFSCEDATRTDLILWQGLDAVVEAGANIINIPDTAGHDVPEEFGGNIRTFGSA